MRACSAAPPNEGYLVRLRFLRDGRSRVRHPRTDDANLVGRHTGVGFGVKDLTAAHRYLAAKGVDFWMPPEKQPWGGFMAMFRDPDGNSFYLDQLDDRHADH